MSGSIAASMNRSTDQEREGVFGRALSLELQLWVVLLLIMAVGLVMIYSASAVMALEKFSDPAYFMKRHFIYFGLGLAVMTFVSCVPYWWYRGWWLALIMGAVLAALVAVLAFGVKINEATRWIYIHSISVQPAEIAKVAWVVYLSAYLTKKEEKILNFNVGFLPPMLMCALFCGLILKQSDFGTPVIIGTLTVSMMVLGGVRFVYLSFLIPPALFVFFQYVYRVPYRWERITAFINPWTDALDSGYQLIQAWIAVGSGGLWGKGLGAGQQKLFYLPEPHTDFILAVIGEEMGFAGILVVVVLFALLFRTGLKIAQSASDFLGSMLAMGLTLLFSFQALINMGVVLGLFPTKGLPLPFISYGGSAFTANCVAAGIMINVARHCGRKP